MKKHIKLFEEYTEKFSLPNNVFPIGYSSNMVKNFRDDYTYESFIICVKLPDSDGRSQSTNHIPQEIIKFAKFMLTPYSAAESKATVNIGHLKIQDDDTLYIVEGLLPLIGFQEIMEFENYRNSHLCIDNVTRKLIFKYCDDTLSLQDKYNTDYLNKKELAKFTPKDYAKYQRLTQHLENIIAKTNKQEILDCVYSHYLKDKWKSE